MTPKYNIGDLVIFHNGRTTGGFLITGIRTHYLKGQSIVDTPTDADVEEVVYYLMAPNHPEAVYCESTLDSYRESYYISIL